jgi:hypothetical protein
MRFIETIDVPTPAATVFDFVSDFKNLPKWDPTIVRVEQTLPGPVQRGTTYIVVLRFLGLETTMHYLVDAYSAPTHVVLFGTAAAVVATDTVTVEPRATGGDSACLAGSAPRSHFPCLLCADGGASDRQLEVGTHRPRLRRGECRPCSGFINARQRTSR